MQKLNVGVVGIGFMGWIHYLGYRNAERLSFSAFVSRDEKKRRGDWRGIQGNFGPPGEEIDVQGVSAYASLDELLADESIELVDICLPPYAHVDAVEKSLKAGKHVLCEKPITLTASDAQRLVEAAEASGKKLLVGHVLPFMPEFAYLVAAVREKRFGEPIFGEFRRVIGPVDWNPDFFKADRVGGSLVDLLVHDAHLIRLLFGMPTSVTTIGTRKEDTAKFVSSLMAYDDQPYSVALTGGVTDSPKRTFSHGYEVQFEEAVVKFSAEILEEGIELSPLKVMYRDGRMETPELGDGDPVAAFHKEFAAIERVLLDDDAEPILAGALAADALKLCELQDQSMRRGQTVRFE